MQSPVIIGDRAGDEEALRALGMDELQELIKDRRGQWATYVDRGPHRVRWEGDVR